MKTNLLARQSKMITAFFVVFLWTSFYANAQCPTVTNSSPPAICDASGYTFSDLSNDYAVDTGDGIVWFDAASGGNSFNGTQLVTEGTFYADNNSGDCSSRVSIVVDFQVDNSGQNLDKIYCSNDNASVQTYIDDVLQSSIPSGGSLEVYNDLGLTSQANPSDPIAGGASSYFIVFVDNSNCKSQLESGQLGVFSAPDNPTPITLQTFCSDTNPTIGDLDPGTASTNFSWYTNVDGSGNPISPALSLSTPLSDGSSYFIQVNDVFCTSNAVEVTVEVDDAVDAGNSATLEYCSDNLPSPFNLFDQLGGIPDITGNWSGPLVTTNGYQGTVDISSLNVAGTYTFTYTVLSNTACPDSSASVDIIVYETWSSGTTSAQNPVLFCESGLPTAFNLFSLVENYDPNGQWTQGTSSSGAMVDSTIDLTGFTPATYNFTYTQNVSPSPCPEESTTVQVIVLTDPDAGVAINQMFCENELTTNSPFDLFDALDGSQDHNNGVWTDSSNNTISNSLDITTFTVAGSPYTFSYTIENGVCSDTEPITITIEPAPESGTANAPAEFCEGSAPASFDLFELLTSEDQSGVWYIGNDTSGSTTSNLVDLSGFTPATYFYTYDVSAIGSCDDENVTVSVIINPLPNTGTPSNAIFCENDLASNSPLDLFDQLAGEDTGGTWSDDDTTNALTGSDVDLTALLIGSYNFTYSITDSNGCSNSSTVTVIVNDAPESGTANSPEEFCLSEINTGQTYNLFELLTEEDQIGTWNDGDATGQLVDNILTLEGLGQGSYNFTYDVDAIGSCDDENVTVTVVINDTNAPTATTPQEFCDSATVADLTATGNNIKWYDAATGGNLLTSTDPLSDGVTYYATQTDGTTGCESSARTPVSVNIYTSPNAGASNGNALIVCSTDNNIDLFAGLDGTQDTGGTWSNDDSVGTLIDNIFNAIGLSAGTFNFTYTVTGTSPCADDSTVVIVTVEEPFNAGADGEPLELCSNNGTVDLFDSLKGNPQTGGAWSPALASGTGVYDPLVDAPGIYTYSYTNACGTASSSIDVSVTLSPNAGADASITMCKVDAPTDLFTLLGTDAQNGGTWSPALASGTGVFNPAEDAEGDYVYTVTATSPCSPDATALVSVSVNDSPAIIVNDTNPSFCLVDNPTVADLAIGIRPSGTVNWYEDAALTLPLNGTEALVNGEDYYATQTTSSGCESSNAVQLYATVNDAPTPTLKNASEEYCINDGPTVLDLTNNVSEYNSNTDNVVWYDSDIGGSTISSSSTLTNTTYYAALIDPSSGCESSTRLSVTPDLTACGKVELPDGFSPNGDGVNDTYDIDNVAILYPNFEIEIFNRNGNVVYKGNASTPRFDGTSNQSRLISKGKLPVGVYFYIFKFNDGKNKPEQGRLYLSR